MAKAGQTEQVLRISRGDPEDADVLRVARRVAATIGADFFGAITRHLAQALAAECVLCGEFKSGPTERVVTLAASLDGGPASFTYELAGSASAQVVFGKPALWRSDVQSRFPKDELLRAVGAQACAGVPLLNPDEKPIGILMAVYRRPVPSLRIAKTLLQTFAARAAAELSRKQEDDCLRESEQRHRVFVERNMDPMWRVEFDPPIPTGLPEEEQVDLIYRSGYIAEANDAFARVAGFDKAEQVIGSHVQDIAPWSSPRVRDAIRSCIRTGYAFTTVEATPVDANGNRRFVLRSQCGIVEDGKLERVWGSSRDITELRNYQLALDASEQRMSSLVESLHLAVVMLDPEGRITFCNQFLYDSTGWKPEDLQNQEWAERMIPDEERERVRSAFTGCERVAQDGPIHFESTLIAADGHRRQYSWDTTALCGPDGKIMAWANVGRDITDYNVLEGQLRQAQKLSSIGRLAGGVAHDFNNLLTVIMGYSGALLEKRDPADSAFAGLTEIRKAAERGAELTHRLLAFSRRQILQPQVLNLNTLIADTARMLLRLIGDEVHLSTNLDPALGWVRVDGGHFHQVLVNLAVNAHDAMPEGGTLTISTSNLQADARGQIPGGLSPGEYVELVVADTGTGMTEEVKGQIFEPFFTTKAPGKGTGLGLSTVYGIVQQSGGQIVVETEPGKGTAFRIFLARVPAEAAAAAREPGAEAAALRGTETILLVEDQEEVRKLTAGILAGLGYNILEADSSARALELAQDRSRAMHLLLTDVMMPNLAGGDLADLVRTYQGGIKVLFMSGYTGVSGVTEKLCDPNFGFLQKPFTPEALALKVREILDQH